MQILIMRHGIAENHSADGRDESRQLTDEGIEKTTLAAKGLCKLIDHLDVILTSPRVRAAQTAGIVGKAFGLEPQVMASLGDGPAAKILRDLRKRREESICVVGHDPSLSRLVEMLCTPEGGEGFVGLKNAGCALIEADFSSNGIGPGQMYWLATPKMLRAVGGGK
ncbi:MAG: phosphohistidine phosphatase SixA [Phycisphaeraceae bacterium]|nr:phosphohistidine phosphatase SixA [Phycisphaeraceae bacterium]